MRIDALPITHVPQIVKNLVDDENPSDYQTRINCVLRFPSPPQGETLLVEVNGSLKEGIQEGQDVVVSWQFGCGSDSVSITRRRGETIVGSWQGCWNERDALLGMGSLDLQIYFNGKKQAPHLARMLASPPLTAALVNEHVTEEGEVASEDGVPGEGGQPPSAHQRERMKLVQVPLVRPERVPGSEAPLEVLGVAAAAPDGDPQEPSREARRKVGENEEGMEQSVPLQRETPECDQVVPASVMPSEDLVSVPSGDGAGGAEIVLPPPPVLARQEATEEQEIQGEAGPAENEGRLSIDTEAVEQRPEMPASQPPSSQVWVFYADPARQQASYDALMALLARLPSKSLVADLRTGPRSRGRQQQNSPLAQEHLRACLGGKYANVSQEIMVVTHGHTSRKPNQLGRRGSRTASVVDLEGEGMQRLGRYVRDEYICVLLDDEARYHESVRYAVAEALRTIYGCVIRTGEE